MRLHGGQYGSALIAPYSLQRRQRGWEWLLAIQTCSEPLMQLDKELSAQHCREHPGVSALTVGSIIRGTQECLHSQESLSCAEKGFDTAKNFEA